MEMFLRQQFEVLLEQATASFAERTLHRCGGPAPAVAALRSAPDAEPVRRDAFVAAFFADNLLDNAAGRCFVLEALERRTLPADPGGPAGEVLDRLAGAAFAEVLTTRTIQSLEQQQIFS
jgi:hypothetical protein